MPVAQRGCQDDCIRVNVINSGKAKAPPPPPAAAQKPPAPPKKDDKKPADKKVINHVDDQDKY
jgi:hypothetical protein